MKRREVCEAREARKVRNRCQEALFNSNEWNDGFLKNKDG